MPTRRRGPLDRRLHRGVHVPEHVPPGPHRPLPLGRPEPLPDVGRRRGGGSLRRARWRRSGWRRQVRLRALTRRNGGGRAASSLGRAAEHLGRAGGRLGLAAGALRRSLGSQPGRVERRWPPAGGRAVLERPDRRVAEPLTVGDRALTRHVGTLGSLKRRFRRREGRPGSLRRLRRALAGRGFGKLGTSFRTSGRRLGVLGRARWSLGRRARGLGKALPVLAGDVRRVGGRRFLGGAVGRDRRARGGGVLGRESAALAGGDRLGAEPGPEGGREGRPRCGVALGRRSGQLVREGLAGRGRCLLLSRGLAGRRGCLLLSRGLTACGGWRSFRLLLTNDRRGRRCPGLLLTNDRRGWLRRRLAVRPIGRRPGPRATVVRSRPLLCLPWVHLWRCSWTRLTLDRRLRFGLELGVGAGTGHEDGGGVWGGGGVGARPRP